MQLNTFLGKSFNYVLYFVVCHVLHSEGKRCRTSDIDIRSSSGVKIEPVTLSRVHLPKLSKTFSHDGHKLTFEFRTTSPSGMLLYGISPDLRGPKLIALQLVDGMLYFTVICPSAAFEFRLPTPDRVDDGEWHSIEFRRKSRMGYITVDQKSYFRRYSVTCKLKSFVFGGIAPQDELILSQIKRTDDHFDGCIRRLRHLRQNVALETSPEYSAVSNCS